MLKILVLAVCLAGACATAARSERQPTRARIADSGSERVAATRASDPKIDRETEERRWGLEQAKERRLQEQAKREAAQRAPEGADHVRKSQKQPQK